MKLPSHPQLSETHFDGLEHLTDLTIDNEVKVDDPQPEKYFLWPLRNLNKLELKIKHPFGDTPLSEEGSELITSLYSRHGKNCNTKTALASKMRVHGHKSIKKIYIRKSIVTCARLNK